MHRQPIIIDNGAYECRAGFANKNEPSLIFKNVVMKSRSRQKSVHVGDIDDVGNIGIMTAKSPFENNLVTQIDVQETIFDYIFNKLGVTSLNSTPIVLNEAFLCPQTCRAQMCQLLLETYSVNKIAFFVDGLSSYYNNFYHTHIQTQPNTLMVSFGYNTTHIMPFTKSLQSDTPGTVLIPSSCRRLNIGGAHISWHLQYILNLKYQCHLERLTSKIIEEILHKFGRVSTNYREEMAQWKNDDYRIENTTKWSLPFTNLSKQKATDVAERRQLQAERLRGLHKKRYEKEKAKQTSHSNSKKLKDLQQDFPDSNTEDIDNASLHDINAVPSTPAATPRQKKSTEFLASFAFPNAVQAQLTCMPSAPNAGLSEKQIQRRALAVSDLENNRGDDFSSWLMQIRFKRDRLLKQRTLRLSRIDLATELGINTSDSTQTKEEQSSEGPVSVKTTNTGANNSAKKIEHYANVPSRSGALNERRKRQLEKIHALAAELKPDRIYKKSETIRKRKIDKPSVSTNKKIPIKKQSNKPSSELTGTEQPPLLFDEMGIDYIDETFETDNLDALTNEDSQQAQLNDENFELIDEKLVPEKLVIAPKPKSKWRSTSRKKDNFEKLEDVSDVSEGERDQLAVLDSVRASYDPDFIKETGTAGLKIDLSDFYQISLGNEPIRATEAYFERSLIGSTQSGVDECFSWVLKDSSAYLYENEAGYDWIPERLFLTGGSAKLPGMSERLSSKLQQLLPWGTNANPLEVVVAADPSLDAWRGARFWCNTELETGKGFITRQDYEECGLDYLRENAISNRYYGNTKNLDTNPKFNPGRGRQPNL